MYIINNYTYVIYTYIYGSVLFSNSSTGIKLQIKKIKKIPSNSLAQQKFILSVKTRLWVALNPGQWFRTTRERVGEDWRRVSGIPGHVNPPLLATRRSAPLVFLPFVQSCCRWTQEACRERWAWFGLVCFARCRGIALGAFCLSFWGVLSGPLYPRRSQ